MKNQAYVIASNAVSNVHYGGEIKEKLQNSVGENYGNSRQIIYQSQNHGCQLPLLVNYSSKYVLHEEPTYNLSDFTFHEKISNSIQFENT